KYKLDGSPGKVIKHFIEDIKDVEKYFVLPETDELPKIDSYFEFEKKVGERGLILIGIDKVMYAIHRHMGSEFSVIFFMIIEKSYIKWLKET
ncbi:MAG: hypothetical protein NZ891_04630, partial [bacterium]|nr:hypothetical protein [bacterium]MDW8164010.1 hypothetical protein [Candidatus Omnitrophota bacterium]